MSEIWQDIVALCFVALAGIYLARQAWLKLVRKKSAGCGGCGTCPQATASPSPESRPLVTLSVPPKSTR